MKPIWNRWQCFLKSVWGGYPMDYYIDGHSWVEQEEHTGCNVTISRCEVCGKLDTSWSGVKEVTTSNSGMAHINLCFFERVENEKGNTPAEQFVEDYDNHEEKENDMNLTSKDRAKLYELLKVYRTHILENDIRELAKEACEYVERMEETVDGEWGRCRDWQELYKAGTFPDFYDKLKLLTSKHQTLLDNQK